MQKLVIVGQDQQRLSSIKMDLRELSALHSDLRIQSIRPGYLQSVIEDCLQFLIFDTNIVNRNVFPFVVQVRKAGFTGPILVLGRTSSKFDLDEFNSVRNLFHLPSPYEPHQLVGLVKNCLNIEMMHKRKNQRFSVNESATLESYGSDFKAETTINDLSRGGVRVQGNLAGLKKGDLLRLQFNFTEISSERVMSARVVWVKKESDNKEQAGLEFVSQKAVYKYLLDYDVA